MEQVTETTDVFWPTQRISNVVLIKKTLVIFIPIFAFLLAIAVGVFYLEYRAERRMFEEEGRHSIEMARYLIRGDIEPILSDLKVLGRTVENMYLPDNTNSLNPEYLKNIHKLFLFFSTSHKIYDQIRFLNDTGMELIRINYNNGEPETIAKSELQNKSHRYYFKDTIQQNKGEIYISPFDLNIEHGKIEYPLKPMIRFGMPVFDMRKRKRGIIILNYSGSNMLSRLKINQHGHYQSMLVNSDGYWLKGTTPEQEWGFMFEDRQDETFAKYYPQAWEKIKTDNNGQFETSQGLFTYTTIYPLNSNQKSATGSREADGSSEHVLTPGNYYWKIISQTTPGKLYQKRNYMLKWGLGLLALLNMILLIGAWKVSLASLIRKQAENALRKSKAELEEKIKERTFELIESEEKYRSIMESMEDAVYICSPDFHIEYMNPSMIEKIGSDARGEYCFKALYNIDNICPWCIHDQIKQGNFQSYELTNPLDGKNYLISNSPIFHENGTISKLTVFRDITNIKSTEIELKTSTNQLGKRLKELQCLYNISSLIHSTDLTTVALLENAVKLLPVAWQYPEISSARITYTSKEFKTHDFKESPWKQKSDIVVFGKKIGEVEVFYSEARPELDEGPFLKEERSLINVIAERLGDAIEHRQSEDEKKKSEERFKTLVETMSEGTAAIDDMGIFTYVNSSFCKIVDRSLNELIGHQVSEYIEPTCRDLWKNEFENRKSGRANPFEMNWVTKSGHTVITTISPTVLYNQDGNFTGSFAVIRDVTEQRKVDAERKKVERALQESEFKFASHIKNTPVGVMEINDELAITSWNSSAERIFGYSAEESIGRKILDLLIPDYEYDNISSLFTRETAVVSENINDNKTKDGRIITCQWFNTPIKDLAGNIVGLSSICQDITESIQNLEKLREREESFRELVEGTDNLITKVNSQGELIYVNHAARKIFGISPEECLGQSAFSFVDDRDLDNTQLWFKECLSKHVSSGTFENRQKSRTGEVYDMIWTVNFHYNEQDEIDYITSIARDISEQKRQEQALKARLRLSEYSIAHSVDELLQKFLDEAEVLTDSSIGFFHFLEPDQVTLSLQMWSTNTLTNICQAEGKGTHYPVSEAGVWVDAILERRPVIHNDYESLPHKKGMPEGHAPVVRQLVVPVVRKDKIVAILGVGNKQSNYFKNDVKIVAEMADMAWELVLRTRAEEEKNRLKNQLLQSQKMEAIGTLAGGIAHDFNNILHAIIGYGQLTEKKLPIDHPAQKNLNHMLKASFRAADLVRQILNFSRQTKQDISPIEVIPIIKEVIKLLRASTPATIEIHQNINTNAGLILADPTQIHQVIMNLGTNACHAMRNKAGILTIGFEQIEIGEKEALLHLDLVPGQYLRLSISDTGHGINQDQLDLIFDPFYTTKETGEGTGLGLSVVHGIIKDLNGAIKVYSEPEIGTTFHIYLPGLEAEISEHTNKQKSVIPTGSESILFVDDEEPLVDIGKQFLVPLGYRFTGMTSSIDALALFKNQPDQFDLVISDQTMPKMTGLDMSQEMLQIRSDIPIIICSGFSEQLMVNKSEKIGIKHFLYKPLISDQLARIIREVLD